MMTSIANGLQDRMPEFGSTRYSLSGARQLDFAGDLKAVEPTADMQRRLAQVRDIERKAPRPVEDTPPTRSAIDSQTLVAAAQAGDADASARKLEEIWRRQDCSALFFIGDELVASLDDQGRMNLGSKSIGDNDISGELRDAWLESCRAVENDSSPGEMSDEELISHVAGLFASKLEQKTGQDVTLQEPEAGESPTWLEIDQMMYPDCSVDTRIERHLETAGHLFSNANPGESPAAFLQALEEKLTESDLLALIR